MYICVNKSTTFVKKKVALLTGGYGAEYNISMKSAAFVEQHVDADRFETYVIHIERDRWYHRDSGVLIDRNDFSLQLEEAHVRFDFVLIIIHGDPAENGRLQGYFESLQIPISCCDTLVSALTFNKYLTNLVLAKLGIRSASSLLVRKSHDIPYDRIHRLRYPLFVKPNRNGSSYGITKVKCAEDLDAALKKGFSYDTELIIEEFMDGREFTCGAMQTEEGIITFPITEIISYNEYFDYAAKYESASDEICPADLEEELVLRCQKITRRIYSGLGCRGAIRADFILRDKAFHLIEVNTIPGMTENSLLPQQVRAHGWTIKEFLTRLISLNLA